MLISAEIVTNLIQLAEIMAANNTDRGTSSFDFDPGPVPAPSRPVDRFGFVKQDQSGSPDELAKCKSVAEQERCALVFPPQQLIFGRQD